MNITTVADTKTYLQLTSNDVDTLIQLYIDVVQSEISAEINVPIAQATYTEALSYSINRKDASDYTPFNSAYPENSLFLRNGLNVSNLTIVQDTTTVSSANYNLDADNGVITLYSYLDDSQNKLRASYTAGYTTVSAPFDLKKVVWEGVRAYYQNNTAAKQGGGDVKSKNIKDFSVSYGNTETSLNGSGGKKRYIETNESILSKYRRTFI